MSCSRGSALRAAAIESAIEASRQPAGSVDALAANGTDRVAVALSAELARQMAAAADRGEATRYDRVLTVLVERERARFGAWYEMFPRSAGTDPTRSATFDEAAARLPYVASMGFDVLYLPPIHPIGRSFRKGPQQLADAGAGDPGSPWAIGSAEGGHMAVEPGLGTLDDFDASSRPRDGSISRSRSTSPSRRRPIIPMSRQHPEWFRHRPDGTIKYAENPPKKYQDIYPFDFESADWPALWRELNAVFEFWIGHGVSDLPRRQPAHQAVRVLGVGACRHPARSPRT